MTSMFMGFDPGDRVLNFFLIVMFGAAFLSTAGWAIARALRRQPAARHLVLYCALISCLALPALACISTASGVTFISIFILPASQVATESTPARIEPQADLLSEQESAARTPAVREVENSREADVDRQKGDRAPLSPHASRAVDEIVESGHSVVASETAASRPRRESPVRHTLRPEATLVSFRALGTGAMFVWAAGALLMLARLARNCRRVVQLRRSSRPPQDERLQTLLREVAGHLGTRQVPLLLVSSRTVMPMAVSFGRPAVVLPERLLRAVDDAELRDVLAHEMAHLQRRDHLTVLLQALAGALYWPIVSMHGVNRELQRACEEVCDNVVLAGRDAISYGETLLHVAELLVETRPMGAGVGIIGGKGELERRITGLIDPRRNTMTRISCKIACVVMFLFIAGGAIASATRFAASAAAEEPSPRAVAEDEEPKAKAVEPAKDPHHPDKQVEIPSKGSGADVSLELDKPEYFLGENVVLHWRIRNAGNKPLKFDIGGDGRTPGAKRAIRFKIEAFDADGKPVPDPYPNPTNMGGLGGELTLDPGEDFWDTLQLMRYREFASPGEYTVKVYHDLGWEKHDPERAFKERESSNIPPVPREAPIVTTNIRFLMPNAEQARQVVDGMLAMPDDAGRTWGKKGNTYADFELLRYPVYLPIAKELAQDGDVRGVDAIGAMAFPEATAALLELMKHGDAAIAAKAGDLLLGRTPDIRDVGPSRRNYLVDRAWTDDLKKSATAPAWKLLAEDDREGIIRGARLIQSLGNKDDLPALINVMDRVLVALKDNAIEQRAYLRPANASETLANASRKLLRRGAQPPDSASTPGNAVVWLLGLGLDENFRPDGWRETARSLIKHEIPFIRDVALRNLPLPLDDATLAVVAEAIKDDFAPVQGAACELADKVKSEAFGPPLIDVLKSTKNDWVMRAAFRSATECGVENDRRLEICVRRMEPRTNDWNMLMLSLLLDGAVETNGYGARAIDDWTSILPGIQTAWLEFIDSHRQELREGTRFKGAAPPLTPKMFPPGFRIHRVGQPAWPVNTVP